MKFEFGHGAGSRRIRDMSATDILATIGSELVRVAFGSPCVVCEGELPVRRRVGSCCVDCWATLPRIDDDRCARCGLPMPGVDGSSSASCIRCITEPLETSWIDSWGRYDSGLAKVLHAFKFRGHAFLADPLSDLLVMAFHRRGGSRFDVLVPVPMTRSKERKRGYNQAELLARSLARRLGARCDERILRKVVERRTQSELKKDERRANVRGTFSAEKRADGMRVLLVDDICTTGETLSACAEALVAAGATEVAALTVARTPRS